MNQKQRASEHLDSALIPDMASILLVDDQRFDRQRLKRLLGGLGMTLHIAEAESLEAMGTQLTKDKFDLVILDYNLADGTGMQAIDALRSDRKNRHAATIMVTGENQFDIAIEALRRGCNDYISKDELSTETLQHAMITALQKSSLREGMESQEKVRLKIESVLDRFARECVLEIKPLLSRMLRQVRSMGTEIKRYGGDAVGDYMALEQSCARLFEFLEDLEQSGSQDFSDLFDDTLHSPPPKSQRRTEVQERPKRPVVEQAPVIVPPSKPVRAQKPRLFGAR